MKILRRLIGLVLGVAALYGAYRLAQANGDPVTVDYVYGTLPEAPQWMVVGAAFLSGAALTALLLTYRLAKQGLVARRYRKTVRGLESEIHELRNLPLAGGEGTGGPEPLTAAASGAERGSAAGPSA